MAWEAICAACSRPSPRRRRVGHPLPARALFHRLRLRGHVPLAGVQQTALEMLAEFVPDTEGMVVGLGLPRSMRRRFTTRRRCSATAGCSASWPSNIWRATASTTNRAGSPWPPGDVGEIEMPAKPSRSATCSSTAAACGSASRSAETPGSPTARRPARPARRRYHAESQREPFRVRQAGSPRAVCARRLAGVLRWYVYCNLLGNETGRAIYDGGTLIASGGKMLARGPRFSFADWVLTTALVDIAATRRRGRRSTKSWTRQRVGDGRP